MRIGHIRSVVNPSLFLEVSYKIRAPMRLFCLVLLIAACGPTLDPCAQPIAPLSSEIHQQIFAGNCAISSSCHSSSGRRGNLDLSTEQAACRGLKNVVSCEFPTIARAAPGMPAGQSYLVQKLLCPEDTCPGTPMCPGESRNDRMPASTTRPLASCQIDAIRKWIEMGMPGCP